jgi:site-specific DNA recombinase
MSSRGVGGEPRPRGRDAWPRVSAIRVYGRVSTEDWQDPETSRARQLQQALMLVAGHGTIVAEFFDTGESRTLAWARRPQAAALVAAPVVRWMFAQRLAGHSARASPGR